MIENIQLTDVTQHEFQAPAGKTYAVYNVTFSNISVASSNVNFWVVKNGNAISNDTKLLNAKTLTSGNVYNFNEKLFLTNLDKLVFNLDSGTNQINVIISYIEI